MYKFKNFSDSAGRVLSGAVSCACKMGHITVGTEHLLLGVLASGKSDATDLLAQYNINFSCVYDVIIGAVGKGQKTMLSEDDFSTNALTALKNACTKADMSGRSQAGVNDILYRLCQSEKCMAFRILSTLAGDMDKLKSRAEKLCSGKAEKLQGEGQARKELKNLEKYSKNLTKIARTTPFDPCIGREKETQRLIQILLRRSKNNPCLIGKAGVGKTAIVEGLANMIAAGDVPGQMIDKEIYALDMAYLLAGTKYRGDFEERIKTVLEEASGDKDIILFIDEIHVIVSAGGAEGAIDAANILKPALARGQIQVIGATTADEYAATIEKDTALDRRFSPINIEEPDKKQAVEILRGLKDRYRQYHKIEIDDSAIEKSVELSDRYISYRFLPDKAIDLMDESCAAARVEGKNRVEGEDVTRLVSRKTGLPVEKIKRQEREKYTMLSDNLKKHVIGQDWAMDRIHKSVVKWRAGLSEPGRPIACFMFCGPSGVGKTYCCNVLCDELFNGRKSMLKIDCTEYSSANDVSKLIGSPPGYVGYDDGGLLEREMSAGNIRLVLFDEIEKAHSDLYNILLQAMEDGVVTTGRGKKISFKDTFIMLTSNLGGDVLSGSGPRLGFEREDSFDRQAGAIKEVKSFFPQEFIGRLDDIVPFVPLGEKAMKDIVNIQLKNVCEKLEQLGIAPYITDGVTDCVYKNCCKTGRGARGIKETVSRLITIPASEMIINGTLSAGERLTIKESGGEIVLSRDKKSHRSRV